MSWGMLSAVLMRARLQPAACRAGLSSGHEGKHREQQKGARKWQNLFKTSPNQGAINQAQK